MCTFKENKIVNCIQGYLRIYLQFPISCIILLEVTSAKTLRLLGILRFLDKSFSIFSANAILFFLLLVEDLKLYVIQINPVQGKHCLKYIR